MLQKPQIVTRNATIGRSYNLIPNKLWGKYIYRGDKILQSNQENVMNFAINWHICFKNITFFDNLRYKQRLNMTGKELAVLSLNTVQT